MSQSHAGGGARSAYAAILAVAAYRGYVEAIPGTTAPFIRDDFQLDEAGLARLMGFVALASLGSVGVGRLLDLHGRRPVLVACVAIVAVFSSLTAIAPNLETYLACQVVVFALVGAMLAGASVMVAETMPDARRAAALGHVGILDAVGGGGAVLLMPLVAAQPGSWRWLWAVAVLPLVAIRMLRRLLPETDRWLELERRRQGRQRGFRVLLEGRYKRRAAHATGALLLLQISFGGLLFWPYYHAVGPAGLSPLVASAMVILGGVVGLLGFVVGGRLCDRLGRRATAVFGTIVAVAAGAWFYRTTGGAAVIWTLGCAYALFLAASAVALLATQTAILELFPTEVRATMAAWHTALTATGVVVSQFAAAALAGVVGGLSAAVALVGCVALPGVVWFALGVPETRDRGLEEAETGS